MIDYGIICLFALQLAALAGALVAWWSLRHEMADVLAMKSALAAQDVAQQGQISSLEGRISDKIAHVQGLEEVPRTLQKKMVEWEGTMGGMQGSIDAMGDRIRSLHSRINASLRHLKRDADPDDQGDPPDQGQQLIFPSAPPSPPAPPAPAVAPGFGRKRTA
jgi:hypothetical protein